MDLLYIGSGPISNFHVPALKNAGFKIEYLSSINRIDSFYAALIHAGKNTKNLKLILRMSR